jgi:hypothetical protein
MPVSDTPAARPSPCAFRVHGPGPWRLASACWSWAGLPPAIAARDTLNIGMAQFPPTCIRTSR